MEEPIQPTPDVSEVVYTPKDFEQALEELSKKMGYKIAVTPSFFAQDNGTFSLKIQTQIVPTK